MVSTIKDTLQKQLVKKRYRWYREQIAKQTLSYDEWIRQKEAEEREERELLGKQYRLAVVSYDECRADFSFEHYKNADIVVFHAPDGTPDMRELALVSDFFARFPDTVIAYGDEDEMDEKGVRQNPWLKPDWSPDTLISYFYFGGFFAVKKEAVSGLTWLGDVDFHRNLYDFVLKAAELTGEAGHIDSVLFHREKIAVWGMEEAYDDLKKSAYARRGWKTVPEGKSEGAFHLYPFGNGGQHLPGFRDHCGGQRQQRQKPCADRADAGNAAGKIPLRLSL